MGTYIIKKTKYRFFQKKVIQEMDGYCRNERVVCFIVVVVVIIVFSFIEIVNFIVAPIFLHWPIPISHTSWRRHLRNTKKLTPGFLCAKQKILSLIWQNFFSFLVFLAGMDDRLKILLSILRHFKILYHVRLLGN